MRTLRTWKNFGRGWTKRINGRDVETRADDNGVRDLAADMLWQRPVGSITPGDYGNKALEEDSCFVCRLRERIFNRS